MATSIESTAYFEEWRARRTTPARRGCEEVALLYADFSAYYKSHPLAVRGESAFLRQVETAGLEVGFGWLASSYVVHGLRLNRPVPRWRVIAGKVWDVVTLR